MYSSFNLILLSDLLLILKKSNTELNVDDNKNLFADIILFFKKYITWTGVDWILWLFVKFLFEFI